MFARWIVDAFDMPVRTDRGVMRSAFDSLGDVTKHIGAVAPGPLGLEGVDYVREADASTLFRMRFSNGDATALGVAWTADADDGVAMLNVMFYTDEVVMRANAVQRQVALDATNMSVEVIPTIPTRRFAFDSRHVDAVLRVVSTRAQEMRFALAVAIALAEEAARRAGFAEA